MPRKNFVSVLTLVAAALFALPALAAPAPWFYWRSKVDGVRICAQTSPGIGWEEDGGPYEGPQCSTKPRVFLIPVRSS